MYHHFDTDIATLYGINEAIILENIRFWVMHNEANETNFHDGRYWTFNSIRAFESLFPYMKLTAIRSALKSLEENGLIVTGNYNKSAYDRTKWYSLTDKAYALFPQVSSICEKSQMDVSNSTNGCVEYHNSIFFNGQMDMTDTANGCDKKGEPIPDGKQEDRKPDGKPDDVQRRYGEYGNVLLSDGDLTSLQAKFPDWRERIERLSSYMESTGKRYKNHFATICRWASNDARTVRPRGQQPLPAPTNPQQAPNVPSIEEVMEKFSCSREDAELLIREDLW